MFLLLLLPSAESIPAWKNATLFSLCGAIRVFAFSERRALFNKCAPAADKSDYWARMALCISPGVETQERTPRPELMHSRSVCIRSKILIADRYTLLCCMGARGFYASLAGKALDPGSINHSWCAPSDALRSLHMMVRVLTWSGAWWGLS